MLSRREMFAALVGLPLAKYVKPGFQFVGLYGPQLRLTYSGEYSYGIGTTAPYNRFTFDGETLRLDALYEGAHWTERGFPSGPWSPADRFVGAMHQPVQA